MLQLARSSHLRHSILICHQLELLQRKSIKLESSNNWVHLESCRHPLIHLKVLFSTVQSTSALLVQHFPCGEIPHTVIEADLAELVVIGHEVPEGLNLLHLCLLLGFVHDTDQDLILWNKGFVMRVCSQVWLSQTHKPRGNEALTS